MSQQLKGQYRTSAPTLTLNNIDSPLQIDASANLKVTLATLIAGEDLTNNVQKVEQRFSYATITTGTTTTIKSGAGFLHTMIVNGGTTGTITIYDNTAASGTKIADFDTTNALATYTFDVSFATGLTIVTSAATKLTISYR